MELQLLAVFEWRDVKKRQKGAQRVAILLRSPVSVRLYSYAYLLNNKCTVLYTNCVFHFPLQLFSRTVFPEKSIWESCAQRAPTQKSELNKLLYCN